MNSRRNTETFPRRSVLVGVSVAAILTSGGALALGQTDAGRAVQNLGGSTIQIRAADAVRVTCSFLTARSTTLTAPQNELWDRCRDMSDQARRLGGDTSRADAYGLATLGAAGVQQYFSLLQQFSGEEVSSQGRYATEGSSSQFKSLSSRLSAIRRGTRNSGLAFNLQGVDVMTIADNENDAGNPALIGGAAGDSDADLGWAWFGNVEYGFGDRDASVNENAYDADSWAALFGVDYAVNETFVVGAAVNFSRTDVNFDREDGSGIESVSGGGLETKTESLSVFANFSYGAMYASAIVNIGRGEIDMTRIGNVALSSSAINNNSRPSIVERMKSSTDSDQWAAETQIGYTLGEGTTTWDLYGGLSLAQLDIDSFSEKANALGLSFGSQSIDSLEGFFGASVRHSLATDSGVFVPYVTAEYRHEFDNDSRVLRARYSLTPGSPTDVFQGETDDFQIPTDDADQDYFDVTVGVSAQFGNNMAAFLQFNSLLGVKDVSANAFTVGLRGSF